MEPGSVPSSGIGATRMAPTLAFRSPSRPMVRLRSRSLTLDRPRIMGIVNLTPDSFSDGGALPDLTRQLKHAERLLDQGADLLDIGGESTRPGAQEVEADEQLERILPFVREATRRWDVPLSIDTRSARVARVALSEGAELINDVSGMRHDPFMPTAVQEAGAAVVLMHMRGTPADMQDHTEYEDLADEVCQELGAAVGHALDAGVPAEQIVVDPGLGFAKTSAQCLELLTRLPTAVPEGLAVMLGPSRKSFIGAVVGGAPDQRVEGTIAACVLGLVQGVRLFRVHDVGPVRRAVDLAHAAGVAGTRA